MSKTYNHAVTYYHASADDNLQRNIQILLTEAFRTSENLTFSITETCLMQGQTTTAQEMLKD